MARRQRSVKRLLLLSTLALFATVALAQTSNDETGTTADTATATAKDGTTATQATDGTTATTKGSTATGGTTTKGTTATATATAGTTSTVPNLTSTTSTTSTSTGGTGTATLPTLTSSTVTGSAATSYPAASVPPTSNAPFMQKSNMPEGTVFIAVGAILGACGVAVLVWRAVVACLLHRSVKRAALAQHMANDKMAVPGAPPPNFYKYTDHESQGSLGPASHAAAGRGVRRTTRGPIPSATPSQTNLFFSPTAGNTGGGAGNRSSTFLPSGFYAAGQGNTQSQGHTHNISMTNLRPDPTAAGRPLGHTPPESPGLTPHNGPVRGHPQMSTSSLNLNQAPTGRAPSAYLQDLLDEDPSQFPPAQSQTWAQSHSHNNGRI